MSGGHWNYIDQDFKNELFDYEETPTNIVEDMEISELIFDVLTLLHDYDWYISGDTGRESYLEAKKKFKYKWLKGDRNERLKSMLNNRIDEVVAGLKNEIEESL